MKYTQMRCCICRKVAVLGQWFVMVKDGPAHRLCVQVLP